MSIFEKGMEVLEILSKHGEAYIVGGAVRDKLLHNEPHDIDISTNVPMETIESLFECHDIGKNKDFGIVVAKHKDVYFEIAQFRSDGVYTDGRRPDSIKTGVSFKEDAQRRDFTVNAMGMDKDGNVIDYFNGKGDLKYLILRTVGKAEERFNEDYLRMLRAIRFSAIHNFLMDKEILKAIMDNSSSILKVSAERIKEELFKSADSNGRKFASYIRLLDMTGLLLYILPEISLLKEYEHDMKYHPEGKNVLEHVLKALEVYNSKDILVNLGILFHDVGKQVAYKIRDGKHTYHGHAEEGVEIVKNICKRLKIDNNTRDTLVFVTENHMRMHKLYEMKKSKVLKLSTHKDWNILTKVAYCDEVCRGNDLFNHSDWVKKIDRAEALAEKYNNTRVHGADVSKTVNGNLIMELRNLTAPCKEVGIVMNNTMDWIVDNNISLDETEVIHKYIKEYKV